MFLRDLDTPLRQKVNRMEEVKGKSKPENPSPGKCVTSRNGPKDQLSEKEEAGLLLC